MILKYCLILILVFALFGCSADKPEIKLAIDSAFNPDGDYGNYKSWNFVPYKQGSGLKVFEDQELRDWTEKAIVDALAERNLQRKIDSPDLMVGYHGASEALSEDELEAMYKEYDWELPKSRYRPDDQWGKGSLLVFVVEAETGKMLWRSSAEAVLDASRTMKERKELVKNAVQKMLAEMPKSGDSQ